MSDHVYMPAAADAGPASFMRWLKEYGAGGPPVAKLNNPYVGATLPGAHSLPGSRRIGVDGSAWLYRRAPGLAVCFS